MAGCHGYKMVDSMEECNKAVDDLLKEKLVAVDAEGVHLGKEGPLTLLQVAKLDGFVYLFNIYVQPEMLTMGKLARFLESKDIRKVFHSCSGDSAALKCQFNVMLDNVFDIQVAQFLIDKSSGRRLPQYRKLSDLCALYTQTSLLDAKDEVQEKWYKTDGAYWAKKKFTQEMIDYACADVRVMIPDVYQSLERAITEKNLQAEFEEMVQHELRVRWDDTTPFNNRMETVSSLLTIFSSKYNHHTKLSDVTDEDDLAALRLIRLQNMKNLPEVAKNLKIESLRAELEKLRNEISSKGDDFIPMNSHHNLVAAGRKCDVPDIKKTAEELSVQIDQTQLRCMSVMYSEETPVSFLADFERSFIRRLPSQTAKSSNSVVRHLYNISMRADIDDIDRHQKLFRKEGREFTLHPGKLGLYKFFISNRDLPEELRMKAREFINQLQDAGIVEAPKKQNHQRRSRPFKR